MSDQRPNILICTWHDTGRFFGCYGHQEVCTPNVDRLAAEGWLFERTFCTSAKCSPSRGSCMTGRYPQSNGLYYLCHANIGYRFHHQTKHLAELLGERGYHSILHGFHHETHGQETERLGFAACHNHMPAPPIYPCPPCEVIAADAAAWLRNGASGDQPFYLQLGFFETHEAYDFGGVGPDESKGIGIPAWMEDSPELRHTMSMLQGSIKKADSQFGVVMQALADSGLAENTIVLFTIDHGLDFDGAKGTCYEPGLEIPCIMRWPAGGISGGRRSRRLVSNVDFLPTLFELAGLELPPRIDGLSYADEFSDPRPERQRRHVFGMIEEGERRSVRDERYKLIRSFESIRDPVRPVRYAGNLVEHGPRHIGQAVCKPIPRVMLFDLDADPLEQHDLADDPAHAKTRDRLDTALWGHMEEVGDPLIGGIPHIPRWRDQVRDYLNWRHEADAAWAGRDMAST